MARVRVAEVDAGLLRDVGERNVRGLAAVGASRICDLGQRRLLHELGDGVRPRGIHTPRRPPSRQRRAIAASDQRSATPMTASSRSIVSRRRAPASFRIGLDFWHVTISTLRDLLLPTDRTLVRPRLVQPRRAGTLQRILHHGFGRVIGGRIPFAGQPLGAALGVVVRLVAQVQLLVLARPSPSSPNSAYRSCRL